MLNRQKALLELVRLAGGEIDRLVLTKWAFLARHETESRGGASFYDFVPYQYGPFSFSLYQEAEKLTEQGYLQPGSGSTWRLGSIPCPPVESPIQHDLATVANRFRRHSTEKLLDYVYHAYPLFTVNSRRQQLAKRTEAEPAVYTAGYEGKSIDAFLNGLIETGIRHLIDVRANPIARRYGFHRSTLERLTGRLGIRYSHLPSLGISSELRQQLETPDDYERLFRAYEVSTLRTERKSIEMVCSSMRESPSVLVCMEALPQCCHRARLAGPVSKETRLPTIHLS
jgi:uncharacterized protein (DUF488 family)